MFPTPEHHFYTTFRPAVSGKGMHTDVKFRFNITSSFADMLVNTCTLEIAICQNLMSKSNVHIETYLQFNHISFDIYKCIFLI